MALFTLDVSKFKVQSFAFCTVSVLFAHRAQEALKFRLKPLEKLGIQTLVRERRWAAELSANWILANLVVACSSRDALWLSDWIVAGNSLQENFEAFWQFDLDLFLIDLRTATTRPPTVNKV